MNFQQLRILRESARRQFNLTDVANALFTAQSGVSRHILDLEEELGVELFIRKGKRLLGLSPAGEEVLLRAEKLLTEADNIRHVAEHFAHADEGHLSIATTHTQARYVLPPVVAAFKAAYPKVHLALHQARPQDIVTMLLEGQADIGIATEALSRAPELISAEYYRWQHALVVPQQHPLAEAETLTLAALAHYPLVSYHAEFTGRSGIDQAFAEAGLAPEFVLSALDADVIKTYVSLGLGVGIIAAMAYDAERDFGLKRLAVDFFGTHTTCLAMRRGHYLKGYAYDFLKLCKPQWEREALETWAQR